MANEREIMDALRAADKLGILLGFQRESSVYQSTVNKGIEILSLLEEKEEGMTISSVASESSISFNTAAIYLRCLEKLGRVEFDRTNPGVSGSVEKRYFLAGRSL